MDLSPEGHKHVLILARNWWQDGISAQMALTLPSPHPPQGRGRYPRLTAINRSFGRLNSSAPLAMASASLVASTSPNQTALARRIRMDQRTLPLPYVPACTPTCCFIASLNPPYLGETRRASAGCRESGLRFAPPCRSSAGVGNDVSPERETGFRGEVVGRSTSWRSSSQTWTALRLGRCSL